MWNKAEKAKQFDHAWETHFHECTAGARVALAQRIHQEGLPGKLSHVCEWAYLNLPIENDPHDIDGGEVEEDE